MMRGSTTVFTVKDVTESLALLPPRDYDNRLRDFDVADLDGNMIFFAMASKKVRVRA
jgi:hypothetical protein